MSFPDFDLDPPSVRAIPDADEGGDAARDAHAADVDEGKQCPHCKRRYGIGRERALGLPLFVCGGCNARWFDSVTMMTDDDVSAV